MDGSGRDPGPCLTTREDPTSDYFYTGKEPCDDSLTWVRYHMMYELSPWQRFWASMYFVTKTVLGVGYGDIIPINSGERIYCLMIAVSGSIFYGFILAGIANFADSKSHDGAKLQEVSEWLEWRRLPKLMRNKINKHFQYTVTVIQGHSDYLQLADTWPKFLRNQVANVVYSDFANTMGLALFRRESAGQEVGDTGPQNPHRIF